MTQIKEYTTLEDGDSEYDVRSCPKKDYNHIAYFLCGHGYTGIIGSLTHFLIYFAPIVTFIPQK